MKKGIHYFCLGLIGLFIFSCSENNYTPSEKVPDGIAYEYGDILEESPFGFSNGPSTNAQVQLGKVLFYDDKLSLNNTVSCATCHKPEFAFGDNKALSAGFEDRITTRNSPPLVNIGQSSFFFWDMSQQHLATQVVMPLRNHIEMGIPNDEFLIDKMEKISYYPELFNAAYGTTEINMESLANSLAMFVKSLQSFEAPFDKRETEPLSTKEKIGQQLFLDSGCNGCHEIINQFGFDFPGGPGEGIYTGGNRGRAANIGLDYDVVDEGAGAGQFKVPTLRNLAFSAPYMHDGRFNTLDEVIEHYNTGVTLSPFLDFRLRDSDGNAKQLNLSPSDKSALKAFLMTLTDLESTQHEMFDNPFVSN